MTSRVAAEALRPLLSELYELPQCGVGGPLHIVTDDHNVDDGSLEFCRGDVDGHWSVVGNPAASDVRRVSTAILDVLQPLSAYRRHKALLLAKWY